MSNWDEAVRRLMEVELACPKCSATNRPGVTYVVLEAPDRAVCIVCSKAFDPHATDTAVPSTAA